MIHIRDNIYEHNCKFYKREKVDYFDSACPGCVFSFVNNDGFRDCKFHAGLCVKHHQGHHFVEYREPTKQTDTIDDRIQNIKNWTIEQQLEHANNERIRLAIALAEMEKKYNELVKENMLVKLKKES